MKALFAGELPSKAARDRHIADWSHIPQPTGDVVVKKKSIQINKSKPVMFPSDASTLVPETREHDDSTLQTATMFGSLDHEGISLESSNLYQKKISNIDVMPPPASARSPRGGYFQSYSLNKPHLLTELNEIVAFGLKKIANVKATEDFVDGADLSRLDVYREAFARFIEDFNIYKPFLNQLKLEYDTAISNQSEVIRNVKYLKLQIGSLQESFSQKINDLELKHEVKISELLDNKRKLEIKVAKRDEKIKKLGQIVEELSQEKQKMREEFTETQVTCLTLTHALTRMEEETKVTVAHDKIRQNENLTLQISASKSHDELERLRALLQEMQSMQENLVSYEIVENQNKKISQLQGEYDALNAKHSKLIGRYSSIKTVIDRAYDDFSKDAARGGRSSPTPAGTAKERDSPTGRGGNMLLQQKNKEEETEEKAEKLFASNAQQATNPRIVIELLLDEIAELKRTVAQLQIETGMVMVSTTYDKDAPLQRDVGTIGLIAGADFSEPSDAAPSPWLHFEGLGYDDKVPDYLRYTGFIQNLFFSVSDTHCIIRDVWNAHQRYLDQEAAARAANPSTVKEHHHHHHHHDHHHNKFTPFLDSYVNSKFGENRYKKVEFMYNLLDSLRKYEGFADCKLLLLVVQGEVSYEVYYDQVSMVQGIVNEINIEVKSKSYKRPDASGPGVVLGLTNDFIMKVIKRLHPHKLESNVAALSRVLLLQTRGTRETNYIQLFQPGKDLIKNKFLDMLCTQHLNESLSFTEQVLECITRAAGGDKELPLYKIREAIAYLDEHKSRTELNTLLLRGCGLAGVEDMLLLEAKRSPVNVESFLRKIKNGLLVRSARTK